jgi:hypothetical protein
MGDNSVHLFVIFRTSHYSGNQICVEKCKMQAVGREAHHSYANVSFV